MLVPSDLVAQQIVADLVLFGAREALRLQGLMADFEVDWCSQRLGNLQQKIVLIK